MPHACSPRPAGIWLRHLALEDLNGAFPLAATAVFILRIFEVLAFTAETVNARGGGLVGRRRVSVLEGDVHCWRLGRPQAAILCAKPLRQPSAKRARFDR